MMNTGTEILRTISPADIRRKRPDPVTPDAMEAASQIVHDVRAGGSYALRQHAERLGDIEPGAPLVLERKVLAAALDRTDRPTRRILEEAARSLRASS